ncbi:tRNA dimethylallyltransferase-like [Pecten maximus]|uniref:tRNA dimethylallyltransferase-like n=1 Tax=Pecten maximus TaxID=6579 RepID=UPI0014581BE5|nr:tRNA dimethylallyltransferase-like [Pecten maximus]
MQVYKGLDISTNKVTAEELRQCPHHMIDFLSPLTRNYTVTDYRDATLPIIDRLLKQEKLPIIVGGTSYYIESLLWNFIVTKQDIEKAIKESQSPAKRQKVSQADPPVDLSGKTGLSPLHSDNSEDRVEGSSRLHSNQDTDGSSGSGEDIEERDTKTGTNAIKRRLHEYGDGMLSDQEKYHGIESDVLYARLKEVDPEMALTLHPNNRRKVIRALEMYDTHNVTLSSVYRAQRSQLSNQAPSGPLRFHHTCVFWLQSDLPELGKRTDRRVDTMIERGLVDELQDFHQQYNADRLKEESVPDYTHGIFQSIGFKEFHNFLILSKEEQTTDKGKQLFKEGVENLKKRTRAYAKYQVKHIRNRYIRRRGANTLPVYGLDVSDVSQWEDRVKTPAVDVLTDILQGREPRHAPIPSEETDNYLVHEVCDICNDGRMFYTSDEWNRHLKSKRHERRKYRLKKEQANLLKRTEAKEKAASGDASQAGVKGDNSHLEDSVIGDFETMEDNDITSGNVSFRDSPTNDCELRNDIDTSANVTMSHDVNEDNDLKGSNSTMSGSNVNESPDTNHERGDNSPKSKDVG